MKSLCAALLCMTLSPALHAADTNAFLPLFPHHGTPTGWVVTAWNDLAKPAPTNVVWHIRDGILRGALPRGSWLVSTQEYGDFELTYEFRLGERGNSGCALRAPAHGDPAFEGLELQMADLRYNPKALPSELTGGIYRAIPPIEQVYRPTEWNRYEISLAGPRLKVRLNGVLIHDTSLDQHAAEVRDHKGNLVNPVKDRPRRGRIGFQELSRDGQVEIRSAKIRVLK
jgi:hypothetical protein